MTTQITAENVLLHKWDFESPDGVTISKDNIEIPEDAEIYQDFRDNAEEACGIAHSLRKTDEGLEADVQLTIEKEKLQTATLAPAITGEIVESDEGEVRFLKQAELESIGLVMMEHEDPRLSKNLKQAKEEETNDN